MERRRTRKLSQKLPIVIEVGFRRSSWEAPGRLPATTLIKAGPKMSPVFLPELATEILEHILLFLPPVDILRTKEVWSMTRWRLAHGSLMIPILL